MNREANVVRLRAAAHQMFGGRRLAPGDEFDAPESDAADLVAMHFATRAITSVEKDSPSEVIRQRKRTYNRRDMRAQK